ncbi:hypothetical protein [Streptomyces shenzhenensis]|uniref:hypothetical protein n=1 Tax=Streptomyces shenzhenensis TaxID=943815 RepID=UPI00367406C1
MAGDPSDALPLVRDALRETGLTYRPFGDARLIDALVRGTPGLLPGGAGFLWMETATAPGAATGVRWLDRDGERAAGALIDLCFPGSYARPGRPGCDGEPGATGVRAAARVVCVRATAVPAGCTPVRAAVARGAVVRAGTRRGPSPSRRMPGRRPAAGSWPGS